MIARKLSISTPLLLKPTKRKLLLWLTCSNSQRLLLQSKQPSLARKTTSHSRINLNSINIISPTTVDTKLRKKIKISHRPYHASLTCLINYLILKPLKSTESKLLPKLVTPTKLLNFLTSFLVPIVIPMFAILRVLYNYTPAIVWKQKSILLMDCN